MERKTIKVMSQGMVAEAKSHTPEASPSAGEPSMPLKVQGRTVSMSAMASDGIEQQYGNPQAGTAMKQWPPLTNLTVAGAIKLGANAIPGFPGAGSP